jgi:hypothetical protein
VFFLDKSATGTALVGRTEAEEEKYNKARKVILPDIILKLPNRKRGKIYENIIL